MLDIYFGAKQTQNQKCVCKHIGKDFTYEVSTIPVFVDLDFFDCVYSNCNYVVHCQILVRDLTNARKLSIFGHHKCFLAIRHVVDVLCLVQQTNTEHKNNKNQ